MEMPRRKDVPWKKGLMFACVTLLLLGAGCNYMLGITPARERYIKSFEKPLPKADGKTLECAIGAPDYKIPYNKLEEFIKNETLRNRIKQEFYNKKAFQLSPKEAVKELRKFEEQLETGSCDIWFYDEREHFRWSLIIVPMLRIFLVDADDNIIACGRLLTNSRLKKERNYTSPDFCRPNTPEEIGIFKAEKIQDWDTVGSMLEIHPELALSKSYEYGDTLLHMAISRGQQDLVELLIGKGADVNATHRTGWTPLHTAAYFGISSSTKSLIAHGADVNAKTDDGKTPLEIAEENDSQEIIDLLKENGAK